MLSEPQVAALRSAIRDLVDAEVDASWDIIGCRDGNLRRQVRAAAANVLDDLLTQLAKPTMIDLALEVRKYDAR